ncbi:hypothetical protein SAY86_025849 [Trapa natans]|uniref:Uncharacterized protein n=1 Tax=Trapa natans TaxID=22666 RepID=A0AAN7KGW7_TRANT|nr:hypothetical protein SAY86_025849 [Trapa natans]
MKHSYLLLAIIMLLLPLFLEVPQAQGTRLGKVITPNHVDIGSGELAESVPAGQGNARKLLMTATTTTSAADQKSHGQDTERNEAAPKGNAKEGLPVKSLRSDFEHYPDIVDIAGMDYSPAKRKPPIHN